MNLSTERRVRKLSTVKPKNRWEMLKEFLAKREKESEKEVTVAGLPEGMIKLLLDKKLKEREVELAKAMEILNAPIHMETLNIFIDDLTACVQVANACVCMVAIPYIRAGDESNAAKLTSGWSEIYSFFIGECAKVKDYWG